MIYPVKIRQVSRYAFEAVWSDGEIREYALSWLQKNCPCRRCQEQHRLVDPLVLAEKISSVGKYALKVEFTSGCKSGIFPYLYLKNLPLENKK